MRYLILLTSEEKKVCYVSKCPPSSSYSFFVPDVKKSTPVDIVGGKSPPVTPQGGSREKKKGFFSHIEGQPKEFNVDDMSLSQAGSADDLPSV